MQWRKDVIHEVKAGERQIHGIGAGQSSNLSRGGRRKGKMHVKRAGEIS